ncbi:MAG: hypothetical protein N2508_05515 [Anaerolineae bacterium]|nr:hypothetical protein [Anaerolineae bacterium]
MQYVFRNPIPLPWLLADVLTLLMTLIVIVSVIKEQTSRGRRSGGALQVK